MSAMNCGCDPDLKTFGKATPYVSPDCTMGHTGFEFTGERGVLIRPVKIWSACICSFADERICPVHGKAAE
jgi:hypothetical protein